ncbi:unnamed protein product [Didymodactylos carnosus]|uniref:Shisa N-terminal domain-containing protein n=1 Tax=Didymodactylos carnosus TaxID=1234261 RepID=A0A814EVU4_9BILA|nr:unnamed protein product [Didymodactylos carnosus]CAF3747596.1 unnamed protein product [Didymodactylos carnosus]
MRISCPGFLDRHGIWNNGFDCPSSSNGPIRACCGTENERYCCVPDDDDQTSHNNNDNIYFSNKHKSYQTPFPSSTLKSVTYSSTASSNDRFSNHVSFLTGAFGLLICFLICILFMYLYFQFIQNRRSVKQKQPPKTRKSLVKQQIQQHDGLLTFTTPHALPYRNMAYLTTTSSASSAYRCSQQNRISTVSSGTGKSSSSRTDTSICDITPLNLYPTMTTSSMIRENDQTNQQQQQHFKNTTISSPSSSSCYVFPSELEYFYPK